VPGVAKKPAPKKPAPKSVDATTAALLETLGVGRTTLYRWIARGILLPPEGHENVPRFGRRARWPAGALERARQVKALIDEGYTLDAIARKLDA
jgi:DNA-binding transcriptional MerR regulator